MDETATLDPPAAPGPLGTDEAVEFTQRLAAWYRLHARVLPWRGSRDPYAIWVSEVMLQQTRVAAVLEHYGHFLQRFPSLPALALASEDEVLAAWSGLGYYRRARMLHRGAQFAVQELGATIPHTAAELRTLPGVGDYTSAAIASIAFGEPVAVVDGNVERVLLRVTGRPEDRSAAGRAFVREQAAALVPPQAFSATANSAGNHNQAMMELGATVCLPRGPLCLQCPVVSLCRTRGEHRTAPRGRQQSRAMLLSCVTEEHGGLTEVLLVRRSDSASLMAGMLELPSLEPGRTEAYEPALRLRHSITTTNYYVEVFTQRDLLELQDSASNRWIALARLQEEPLTGLTRKILMRLHLLVPNRLVRRPLSDHPRPA